MSGVRPPAVRWSEAVLGALLASVAVVAAVSRPWEWLGWLLLVPSAWLLLGTRRACRLRSDDLVAQGRVFRRVVGLRDVRQAGIALGGRAWLQTQDGAVTVLRMVPPLDYGSGHPAPTLVEQIRAAAVEAGARPGAAAALPRAAADDEADAARDLSALRASSRGVRCGGPLGLRPIGPSSLRPR